MDKKCVVVGITGGIAAYKAAQLVSNLSKKYEVHVIMTKHATEFVTPLTFETLSHNRTIVDMFDRHFEYHTEHISLAKKCDAFVIAPASANVIAKIANGICDDMLTTTFLACTKAKVIAPAMNSAMLENPITQANLAKLKDLGMSIVESGNGLLACGDVGKGRLAELEDIEDAIEYALHLDKMLQGKKVLVSAGPTQEALDPVRYLTNHSSGKMGYGIAKAAVAMGAQVTLVSGPSQVHTPWGVTRKNVISAQDMASAILDSADDYDFIVKSAAVADYTPSTVSDQKIKKSDDDLSIPLKRTTDILGALGNQKKEHQIICGFAMESENLEENAKKKLLKKNADMIVGNTITGENAAFGVDTNKVILITKEEELELPSLPKEKLAYVILYKLAELAKKKEA